MTVNDIYNFLDGIAPFGLQDKWDNSGLLVGNPDKKVSKILISLDITNDVVKEAAEKRAELIISHHPVIFSPIKSVLSESVVYKLIENGISAICSHTPLDVAQGGMNDIIFKLLKDRLSLSDVWKILEPTGENTGYGRICTSLNTEGFTTLELAEILKDVFGCKAVKYSDVNRRIKKIAYCSGSGGSMIEMVLKSGADAFITGDIKHNIWIDAQNSGLILFDCGHYHTEVIATDYLKEKISEKFDITVEIAESGKDCVNII